jgi:hypothetical protein
MASEHSTPASTAPGDVFATTHWTVVLAAGRRHTPQSDHALEELCRTYWFPLYAYVRRRGHNKEGRGGFGAGIFHAVSGEELSRGLERRARTVPRHSCWRR